MNKVALLISLIIAATGFLSGSVKANDINVNIGVLAFRGSEKDLMRWHPTAAYLSQAIKGYKFKIVPYNYMGLNGAIAREEIQFVLTNSGHYVMQEYTSGISRLATLRATHANHNHSVFGAVIFTRSDRDDITTIEDLRDKRFMAVKPKAFGGFQMAWRKLKERNIDPFTQFSDLKFSGFPQDRVAYAVRDGLVDAGTFRCGVLENMAKEGKINLSDFKIIEPANYPGFKNLVTTKLYPEWPFSKLKNTDVNLAQKVVIALLNMPPDSKAARAGNYHGWTVPLDYREVHELFKILNIGRYTDLGPITIAKVMTTYGSFIVLGFMMLLFVLVWTTRTEVLVKRRTRELSQINKELAKQITVRQQVEETARQRQAELSRVAELNSMGELASGIAHEINHPLATIINYATGSIRKLHAGNDDRGETLTILERILKQANHGAKILRGLRDAMREDSREMTLSNINEIIRNVIELLEFNLKNNETKLDLELYEALPHISVDPVQIEQVFLNLVGNAIDALKMTHGVQRQIIIATSLDKKNGIIVSIKDNGPGISPELQDRIFDPFISTKDEGMGLGLSISSSIVKGLNGELWIASSDSQGSEFCFSLPIEGFSDE